MFDLGWPELLVIAIVLIVVVGPKDLPRALRSFGRTTTKLRSMAGDFRKQFDEAMREAELDDVKGVVDDVRKLDPRKEIRKHLSPLEDAARDVRKGLDDSMKPKQAKPNADAVEAEPAKSVTAEPPAKKSVPPASASAADKSKPAAKPASAKKASGAKPGARKTAAKAAAKPASKKPAGGAKKPAGGAKNNKKKTVGTAP